ncbi:G-type lectin S-receptor-like serine/threonine-protein kinase SD2-5 isoform X2 [Punica granatum]|nr:G-type lectin S-receptor-like serine/threonine-protein kinase SD2-5 isoform X2 [Punica granatum]
MNWIDKDGKFLVSNDSNFAFGFITMSSDVTLFLLGIVHVGIRTVVWSANWESPVSNSDKFSFNESGDVVLYKSGTVVWSTGTGNKGVSAMELQDSGNLVLVRSDGGTVWQSFSHPSDTLLSNQEFTEGMKLVGIGVKNLSYALEIKSGDILLSAGYRTPQPYWSMGKDTRKIVNKDGRQVSSAKLEANSWGFYDKNKNLLWEFIFSSNTDPNATWIAVLGQDGTVSFTNLPSTGSGSVVTSPTKIPSATIRFD